MKPVIVMKPRLRDLSPVWASLDERQTKLLSEGSWSVSLPLVHGAQRASNGGAVVHCGSLSSSSEETRLLMRGAGDEAEWPDESVVRGCERQSCSCCHHRLFHTSFIHVSYMFHTCFMSLLTLSALMESEEEDWRDCGKYKLSVKDQRKLLHDPVIHRVLFNSPHTYRIYNIDEIYIIRIFSKNVQNTVIKMQK